MTTDPAVDTVRITRIIDAPREDVFRAWTEPDEIRRWWGPGEFTCPEAEVDLRPGGEYRLAMQPTEGTRSSSAASIARSTRQRGSPTLGGGRPAQRPMAPNRS